MRYAWVVVALAVAGLLAVSAVAEIPKPPVRATTWQLDFQHKPLQSLVITLPGDNTPHTYWYMLYTVTNRTGQDRMFVPNVTLYSDNGELTPEGKGVPPMIFSEIKRLQNDPLLQDTTAITGKILQGEDNALSGVLIFPEFDAKASKADVFVGGLSGDELQVKLPTAVCVTRIGPDGKKQQVQTDTIRLVRTLAMHYLVGAEPPTRSTVGLTPLTEEWVLR